MLASRKTRSTGLDSRRLVVRDGVWIQAHFAHLCHGIGIVRSIYCVHEQKLCFALWCIDLDGMQGSRTDENALIARFDNDIRPFFEVKLAAEFSGNDNSSALAHAACDSSSHAGVLQNLCPCLIIGISVSQ